MADNITGIYFLDQTIGVLQEVLNPINLAKNVVIGFYWLLRLIGIVSGDENFREKAARQSEELWTLIKDFISNSVSKDELAYRISKYQDLFKEMNKNLIKELSLAKNQVQNLQESFSINPSSIEGQAINTFEKETNLDNVFIATNDFLNSYICLVIFLKIMEVEDDSVKGKLQSKGKRDAFFTLCGIINEKETKNKAYDTILRVAQIALSDDRSRTELLYGFTTVTEKDTRNFAEVGYDTVAQIFGAQSKQLVSKDVVDETREEARAVIDLFRKAYIRPDSHIVHAYISFKIMVEAARAYAADPKQTYLQIYFSKVNYFLEELFPNIITTFDVGSRIQHTPNQTKNISAFVDGMFETFKSAGTATAINESNIQLYIRVLSTFVLTMFFCQSMLKTGLEAAKEITDV